jgi:hypothetical protein
MELNYDYNKIINNILYKTTKNYYKETITKIKDDKKDDLRCHTLEGLQYCYEMYKVKNNKKADFDIHKSTKYNIEDKDIDILPKIYTWNQLSKEEKNEKINIYVEYNVKKYNLDIKNKNKLDKLIKNNLKNIKYNKNEGKIIDLDGLNFKKENDTILFSISVLKYEKKISNKLKTSRLSKLKNKVRNEKKKNNLI